MISEKTKKKLDTIEAKVKKAKENAQRFEKAFEDFKEEYEQEKKTKVKE